MNPVPRHHLAAWLIALLLALLGGGGVAYYIWLRPKPPPPLPEPGSPAYEEYLRDFQVGTAVLEAGEKEELARSKLQRAVELIPEEPAGWANLGLLNLRTRHLDEAARDLERARLLAPDSGQIEALLGYLAREQPGRLPEAVAHFRKAVEKEPRDLLLLYTLAQAVKEERASESQAEYQRLLEQILKIQPNNQKVLVETAKVAFQRKDRSTFDDTLGRLDRLARAWNLKARKQLAEVHKEVHKAVQGAPDDVVVELTFLDNFLKEQRGYNRDATAVAPDTRPGTPVQRFLRLQQPRPTPAAPERDLALVVGPWPARPVSAVTGGRWEVVRVGWRLSEEERQALIAEAQLAKSGGLHARWDDVIKTVFFVANAREVRRADADAPALEFPGGPKYVAPTAAGVLPFDWDNDMRTDLLLAGAGGLRLYRQRPDGGFDDVTRKSRLPQAVLEGDYYGAWTADLDTDGDLDVILARRSGPLLVLRNNGDGTFKAVEDFFPSLNSVRAFVWADLDNDGMPDAAFLDKDGKLHVFANERQAQFRPWPVPEGLGTLLALTAADLNDDGVFDLVALKDDGTLVRLSDEGERKSWQVAELARAVPALPVLGAGVVGLLGAPLGQGPSLAGVAILPASVPAPGDVALFAEDLDNNGATDLIVAGPGGARVFLADEQLRFAPLPEEVPLRVGAVLDVNGDGLLDLVGISSVGHPARALNVGTKGYRWQVIRPVANPEGMADKRINTFAVGGEAEVRSGPLVQKRVITGPVVHFGLGEQPAVAVARLVWPNGAAQWEFELLTGRSVPDNRLIRAMQRLSGSCPFLFTCDGAGMRFAGDFMWGTPLGMHVNGQSAGDFPQTTEWLKIPGAHLVPKDGYYDVRVQANLWEADYFDKLALIVVDHPPGTEIYSDERFFLEPTAPKLYVTTPARPVARAWDHHGRDATAEVRAIDGRYLDRAGRGPYQGVTADHWVEADLGDDAPAEGPLYLIARGWIHPTDSSINVAIEQGKHDRPRGLVLEVPDGKGGWKVGRDKLGFPAGKDKTILIRLDGIDGQGVSRRFRLRTNMEIYWDFLGYARGLDPNLARKQRPEPLAADLRYRGILEMTQKDRSSPEVPLYDKVIHRQCWRDLTGYYTRFGDVRELLAKVDDRYVIMNAGDEIALRFPVPAGPPAGWKRDFLWESDGWTRDGNLNTRFGSTVLPLPAHDRTTYEQPGRLEDDPVYQQSPQDWLRFHTRYVTSYEFARGLRGPRHSPDRR
jgi:Tfp pilus assembly protein PilF